MGSPVPRGPMEIRVALDRVMERGGWGEAGARVRWAEMVGVVVTVVRRGRTAGIVELRGADPWAGAVVGEARVILVESPVTMVETVAGGWRDSRASTPRNWAISAV